MDYTDWASEYQHFAALCPDLEALMADYRWAVQQLDALTVPALLSARKDRQSP